MKTQLTILACLIAGSVQSSTLNETTDLALFERSTNQHASEFFDEARIVPYFGTDGVWHDQHGFVSLYGALNGGTFFTTDDLFTLSDTTIVSVSWNFAGTDYSMLWIFAYGADSEKLFRVGGNDRTQGSGQITIPGGVEVLAFYGRGPETKLPETGETIALLVLAFGALVAFNVFVTKTK